MAAKDRLDVLTESWAAVRPDLDISPWAVWGRLTVISELFISAVGPVLKRHDLTFNEYQTLAAIFLAGPPYQSSPNQIAQHNLLSSGGIANLLNKMQGAGLVARRPDAQDRRGVVVSLTEDGRSRLEASLLDENRLEHELLRALSEAEVAVLAILLRKLLLSLDAGARA